MISCSLALFPNNVKIKNYILFSCFSEVNVLLGWAPVDLGPLSFGEISSLLSECKVMLDDLTFSNISTVAVTVS